MPGIRATAELLGQANWVELAGRRHADEHRLDKEVSQDIRPVVAEFTTLVAWVDTLDARESHRLLTDLEGAANSMRHIHKTLGDYATAPTQSVGNNLAGTRRILLDAVQAAHDLMAYPALRRKFDEVLSASAVLGNLNQRNDDLEATEKRAGETLRAAEAALVKANEALVAGTVVAERRAFKKAATDAGNEARAWGGAALACAIAIGALVIAAITSEGSPPFETQSWVVAGNLAFFAERALLVSLFSFLLVVCVRNFRSAKHNQVLNKHREHALATFPELRKALSGTVADAVVLHAAEAIFSVQATGYASGEPLAATHVTEILAATKGSTGPNNG